MRLTEESGRGLRLRLTIVVLIGGVVACGAPARETAAERTVVEVPVNVGLAASLQAEPRGDTLYLALQVTNPAEAAVELTFPTGQSFDFVVEERGRELWRWSADRMFTQAIRQERIEAGETQVFEAHWIPPPGLEGEYLVRGFLTAREHTLEQQSRIRLR